MSAAETNHSDSRRAVELVSLGAYDAAERAAHSALQANPSDADAWCVLAVVASARAEKQKARDYAQAALAISAEHEWALRRLARAESDLGNRAKAATAVEAAINAWPHSWRAHILLAEVLTGIPSESARARTAITRALELAPQETWLHRVDSFLAVAEGRNADAAAATRRALQITPDDSYLIHDLGVALFRGTPGAIAISASLFAQAAGMAPEQPIPSANVDYMLVYFIDRFGLYSLFVSFGVAIVTTMGGQTESMVGAAVGVILLLSFAGRFWQHASKSVRRRLWMAATRSQALLPRCALQLAAMSLLIAAAGVPNSPQGVLACAAGVAAAGAWRPSAWRPKRLLAKHPRRGGFGHRITVERQSPKKIRSGIRLAIAPALCALIAAVMALNSGSRLVGIAFAVLFARVAYVLAQTVIRWRRVPIPTLSDTLK